MSCFEFKTVSSDGLKLHSRRWDPETGTKAAICLVHGLGEHSGRYNHVAETFNQAGFALVAFDLRGHGLSEGKRGHAPGYTALMDDIDQLLQTAKERYPNIPVFLYGHSLGGNLVVYYTLYRQPKLAGTIVSAPLFRPASKPPAWKIALLRAMYNLHPSLTLPSGLETAALSRDPEILKAYREDPLVHDRVSARLAMDMLRNGQWNLEHAADLPCPLLLMHGDADRITSAEASQESARRAGKACTLKIWEGFYHELHNEPGKENVFALVLDWIERNLYS